MATVAEAIMSFIDAKQPTLIDVSGHDSLSSGKSEQKTRIYRALLTTHNTEIISAGYRLLDQHGKLTLVRNSNADSTGIRDRAAHDDYE